MNDNEIGLRIDKAKAFLRKDFDELSERQGFYFQKRKGEVQNLAQIVNTLDVSRKEIVLNQLRADRAAESEEVHKEAAKAIATLHNADLECRCLSQVEDLQAFISLSRAAFLSPVGSPMRTFYLKNLQNKKYLDVEP